jgi:tRNA pseudouridine55 synthase
MPFSGLLVIDKPYGMASFKAVHLLKRRFRWQKVGHVGTLDPLATGVLPICIGRATKLIPYLMERHKRYEALIRLGLETRTQDREGDVISFNRGSNFPSLQDIEMALEAFRGETEQVPPMYSALRYKGRRLYEWAREGMEMPREPRKIRIYEITCLAYRYPFVRMDVTCGRGTYIRTLAADIGRNLDTGGHLWALKRLGVGECIIEDALAWDKVMSMERGEIEPYLIPMGDILSFLPAVRISQKHKEAMSHGRSFVLTDPQEKLPLEETAILRIQDRDGEFLGLGGIASCHKTGSGFEICIKPALVVPPATL